MKLLIQNNRIIGTANDEYIGPDIAIEAPIDFDINYMGDYVIVGGVAVTRQSLLTFTEVKAAFILQIDTDTDALIRAVIGERASQYEGAEREALAYQSAGYTGTVPPKVQAWATAKSQTATWAADSQIATAAGWRSVENELYANRLLAKESARNAIDIAALDTVKSDWSGFLAAIKAQLGVS